MEYLVLHSSILNFMHSSLASRNFIHIIDALHRSFSPVLDEQRGNAAVFRVWIIPRMPV